MKIAFVSCTQEFEASDMPLGIAYLSAVVKKHFPGTETIWLTGNVEQKIFEKICEYCPDIICFSSTSMEFGLLSVLSDRVKTEFPSTPIFFGGYHISMVPEDLPLSASAGVIGEGELTFIELLNAITEEGGITRKRLLGIDGVVFYDGEKLTRTLPRKVISNIDDLPMPDWSLFTGTYTQPALISSRGCYFRCAFCSSHVFWGHGFRMHSPERIVEEMLELTKCFTSASLLHFYDDTFTGSVKVLEEIADIINERKLNLPQIWGHGRASLINPRMLKVLKRLNVRGLSFGFESGSNRLLKSIKSGAATLGINARAAFMCYAAGVDPHAHIIIGCPGETPKDVYQSLNLIYMTPLGHVSVNTAMPLPGTEFMKFVDKKIQFKMDYNAIMREHMLPRLADSMTLNEFQELKTLLLEKTKTIDLLLGHKRKHVLIGVPWRGDLQTTESCLTELYSVDYSAGLHVVVFGVPKEHMNDLWAKFPIIIPNISSNESQALKWLKKNCINGIPRIWIPEDLVKSEGIAPDQFWARVEGESNFVSDWVPWRLELEKNNDTFATLEKVFIEV